VTHDLVERLERVRAAVARSSDPLADPLGLDFEPRSGGWHRDNWQRFVAAAREGKIHDRVVLYVHLPFCAKICSYCLLSAQRPDKKETISRYVDAIVRQLGSYRELFQGVPISSLHVGGGTPTLLGAADLDRVLSEAERAFARTPNFVGDLEAHPTTTTEEKLSNAKARGIDRVSFGVESFTPRVLELSNRADQTHASVTAAVKHARAAGLQVNVDLLAGLPGETLESFSESLIQALELEVDALSVNRYIADGSPLGAVGYSPDANEIELASEMLARADELVRARRKPAFPGPGPKPPHWGVQYGFATGSAPSYSQQDMIDPGSVLAIGHGGMGRVFAGYHYIADKSVASYSDQVLANEEPDVLVCRTDTRFEMAFFVVDGACRGGIGDEAFSRVFRRPLASAFGNELEHLVASGLVQRTKGGYRKPERRDFEATHFLAFLCDREASPPPDPPPRPRLTLLEASELARHASPGALDEARGDEYARVDAEVPPSLLWCRLAMRAARAARKRSVT
jgi:coproporphyrinogen III oxidase-like Fe-S oxidoreductase